MLKKLAEDLRMLEGLPKELPEEGARRVGRLHREYLWAVPPTRKGQEAKEATAAYRKRVLTLKLWNDRDKIQLHLSRPELGLEGTNNSTELGASRKARRASRAWEG